MEFSKYQLEIFDHISESKKSLNVEAVAGSGKTTTLLEGVKKLSNFCSKNQILFTAFNRSIAQDLKEKSSGCYVTTLNGLGYGYVRAMYPNEDIKVVPDKTKKLFDDNFNNYPEKLIKKIKRCCVKVVDYCKVFQIGIDGYFCTKISPEIIDFVIDTFDLDESFSLQEEWLVNSHSYKTIDILYKIIPQLLRVSIDTVDAIDFNDQVYIPVINRYVPKWRKMVIFVDESQDLNRIQQLLLKASLDENGKIIFFGDSRQAIYGFRGSDKNSIKTMIEMFNAESLPLSISYRCPKKVIQLAKKYCPQIEAYEYSKNGEVIKHSSFNISEFKPGDVILCRNSAPIISLSFRLFRRKIPVVFMGKDLSQIIKSKIDLFGEYNLDKFLDKLKKWRDTNINKKISRDSSANVSYYEETYETIYSLIKSSMSETVDDLMKSINDISNRSGGKKVILSTIHGFKGMEADNVFILDSWLMPSRHAKLDWEVEQEKNMIYVSYTRSKDRLNFVNTKRIG